MIFLTGLRLIWLFYHVPSEQPIVKDGLLDLRDYDFQKEQPVSLDGEWAFYPEKLVESLDELHPNMESIYTNQSEENSKYKFGTYHLRILLDENTDIAHLFSISIPSVNTASALFVNGHLKEHSGNVGINAANHTGKGNPYTVPFSVNKQEIDIFLQISNFDTSKGITLSSPITFGSSKAMAKDKNLEDILLISMVVILILHSVYSLLIYIFITKQKVMLFFTIGFLFPAIDEMLTYNSASMEWLHLNYEWSFKFKEFIYLGAAFFLVQLMRHLLRNMQTYKRFRWLNILYGICSLLIVVLPLNYLIQVNTLFFILYFASFVSVIPLALKEYFQYEDESIFVAIVVMSTTSGIVWGLIKAITGIVIPFYPFDYLFAFLGFAVFWFKRFYRQNKKVVDLVDELKIAEDRKSTRLNS